MKISDVRVQISPSFERVLQIIGATKPQEVLTAPELAELAHVHSSFIFAYSEELESRSLMYKRRRYYGSPESLANFRREVLGE